jgi:hypothetical protein
MKIVFYVSVYCQQSLCTSELFQDLTGLLTNDDSNTNLKRMSVYVLLVLVSNNSKYILMNAYANFNIFLE